MDSMQNETGPLEVWLSQKSTGVTCLLVREDESTERIDTDCLSFRGAQREVTGYLIAQGFTPDGPWVPEAEDTRQATREAWRRFGLREQQRESAPYRPESVRDDC